MTDAMQAARRIEKRCQQLLLAKINPERDLVGFGDAMVVARALLAREAERDATIEACAAVVEWIYDNGLQGVHAGEQCIRTAKAIRALKDGGQEGSKRRRQEGEISP